MSLSFPFPFPIPSAGINFLAALFLLSERDERDAFVLLCFLLRHRHLEILFNARCSSLLEYMGTFSKRFRKNNKAVYTHLKNAGFGPVCYAIEWFTTCFIVTCPGDLSACVVDLLLLGFDDIMLRVGVCVRVCESRSVRLVGTPLTASSPLPSLCSLSLALSLARSLSLCGLPLQGSR